MAAGKGSYAPTFNTARRQESVLCWFPFMGGCAPDGWNSHAYLPACMSPPLHYPNSTPSSRFLVEDPAFPLWILLKACAEEEEHVTAIYAYF